MAQQRRAGRTVWPFLILAAGAALAALLWSRRADPAFQLPLGPERNVLIVTIDTLRADALGSYGGRARTPNLDSLAARGARFTFAHSHAVVTLPSHTSLMTGQYPYTHGVRDNNGYRVRDDASTLAVRLHNAGFATGAFVGAFPLDQRFGLGLGFDVYDDRFSEVGNAVDFSLPERRADAVVGSASSWIAGQGSKWLAWVHVFDPHAPYQPPEPYSRDYADAPYAGEVAWTDAALGPLFAALAHQPRPTLVIITGDHGESLGEHGELTHGIFAYEATLRVPLIVAEVTPGNSMVPRGVVVDVPVRHVDVLPTILDAVGIAPDTTLAGRSLRPVVEGRAEGDRSSYFEAMTASLGRGWAPLRGVLAGRDKYIDVPIPELYQLAGDPGERRNVMDQNAAESERWRQLLRTFNVDPPGRPGEETAAVRERLRALGYVGGQAPAKAAYTEADDPKRLIDIDQLLHEAGDAYSRGNLSEAAERFSAVIARRPDTADAYRYLAHVHWQAGHPGEAIEVLEQALARGLAQRDIRVKLGLYLAETGQARRALSILETLADPDAESLNALGIAYAQDERPADAARAFQRVLAIDPTNGLAHQNIGTLHLRAGRLREALASLDQALAIDPTLPGAHTARGVVLSRTGRRAEAWDSWRRALALDGSELNALYNLTVELFEAGQASEAATYGERFLAIAPSSAARDVARVRALMARR